MISVTITDLFGNFNITNETPFIVINTHEAYKLLTKIDSQDENVIFKYNFKKINKILESHNLNPKTFVALGDVGYNGTPIKELLFANKKICKYVQFKTSDNIVYKFGKGYVFSPNVDDNEYSEYVSFGMIYSFGSITEIPKILNAYLIPKSIVKMRRSNNNEFMTNKYSLLTDSRLVKNLDTEMTEDSLSDDSLSEDSLINYSPEEKIDIYKKKNVRNNIILKEAENPWYNNETKNETFIENNIENNIVETKTNNKYNFKSVLIIFISIIVLYYIFTIIVN